MEALYGFVWVLQHQQGQRRQSASSLSPSLLLLEPELHSSPLRSIHTQGAAGERAEPLCDQCGNVHKFWNLKPWRGYLPEGSLEPVSTAKTLEQGSFRVEGAVFGGNIALTFPPSVLTPCGEFGVVFRLFSQRLPSSRRVVSPRVCRGERWRLVAPTKGSRGKPCGRRTCREISTYLGERWCV